MRAWASGAGVLRSLRAPVHKSEPGAPPDKSAASRARTIPDRKNSRPGTRRRPASDEPPAARQTRRKTEPCTYPPAPESGATPCPCLHPHRIHPKPDDIGKLSASVPGVRKIHADRISSHTTTPPLTLHDSRLTSIERHGDTSSCAVQLATPGPGAAPNQPRGPGGNIATNHELESGPPRP